ncbi:MAG: type IV secretory system conjugative DNA transfer family protein [Albidovulum sp.]|uniref:type IV secretory system conjugative DNA transfer family protein n=1 Tax=Albidovulum sp. TaxID=1872424 RepID=UPI003C8BB27A
MFVFRAMRWIFRRLLGVLRKKGWLYILALIGFMSLDMIFPALGGNLTTIGLILGPAIIMGLTFGMLKRLDGTMPQFLALSTYMGFAGIYALFRAWSKAAESTLPEVLGPVSRWLFGPLWNAAAGIVAGLLGEPQAVPIPVWGPLPLSRHLMAMDPLLTALSLIVLAWSLRIFLYGASRYGGETQRTPRERKLAQSRITSLWRANSNLIGARRNAARVLRNTIVGPKLKAGMLVIGFSGPPRWRPWCWPWLAISWLVSLVRPVEMTIFDFRRMIVADAGNGAMLIGGSGAGKTLVQTTWLMFSQSSKILIETQGNVFEKDLPLIEAAGRRLLIISTDLGRETATLNVLNTIDPEHQDFWDHVMRISALVIQERGEHGTLERCARELIAAAIANTIYFGRVLDEEPTLETVYAHLTDRDISDELRFWADEGHPAFRALSSTLAARTDDPEFLNSLAAIYSPELGFLAHPIKSAMVCGTGNNRFDPGILLADPSIDVAIQLAQSTIDVSGALLRLLLGALIEQRIQLSAEATKRLPSPTVTLWIDEIAAFAGPTGTGGAPMLREIVDFHRQKGVHWVYSAQNTQQIDLGWGEGTYAKWSNSAVVRIFGKVGADPDLDQHICEIAGKTLQEKIEKIPGAGGGWRAYQMVREEVDLLPPNLLSKMGEDRMVAFVRTKQRGLVKLCPWRPAHFEHPAMKGRFIRARQRFNRSPEAVDKNTYSDALAATKQNLIAQLEDNARSHSPASGECKEPHEPIEPETLKAKETTNA